MIAANPHLRVLVTSREPLRLAAEYDRRSDDGRAGRGALVRRTRGRPRRRQERAGDLPPAGLPSAGDRARGGRASCWLPTSCSRDSRIHCRCSHGGRATKTGTERSKLRSRGAAICSRRTSSGCLRLAIFAGGWTIDAAEEVCDAELDMLQSLVDRASSTATQSVTGCSRQSARSPPNASKRPVRPPS